MARELKLAYVLAADVGNTHIRLGAVRGEQVYTERQVPVEGGDELGSALRALWDAMSRPRRVVACSVNDAALDRLRAASLDALDEPIVVVGDDIDLPLKTALKAPGSVGADRLCAAVAAYGRLEQACVVIDAGTAVTIDCVNDDGVFLGGAILPGARMQARALSRETAQLPLVEPRDPDWVFGDDTARAIAGGIVYGLRGAVRERVEAYATELGKWPLVIVTGGDAELIKLDEGFVQAIVPNLCLMGVARAFYQSLLPDEGE